jgi:hypothetical protein
MSSFEAELDALATNLPLKASLPYTRGGTITELISLPSISFAEKDKKPLFQEVKHELLGKSISESSLKTGVEDKSKYQMYIIKDLVAGDVSLLCRQKRSGGKNTFCLKQNCSTDHRNFNTPKIELD